MCLKKIAALFHRTKKEVTAPLVAKPQEPGLAPAQVKKSRDERWLERHPDMKLISTERGGPNMPKYQPCPICRHLSKRLGKTVAGARYHCPNPDHGNFLVKA